MSAYAVGRGGVPLTREQWLAERRLGLGGSDLPAVLGLSRYKTPLDVYRAKVEGYEEPETYAMRMGRVLEPLVRSIYEEEEKHKVVRANELFRDAEVPILLGTPDGLCEDDEDRGFEAKAPGYDHTHEWGDPNTDEVPTEFVIQCQVYMRVTGRAFWDLGALFAGGAYRTYHMRRDDSLIGDAIEGGRKFWRDHVEARRPPAMDAAESTREYFKKKFEVGAPFQRSATDEVNETVQALRAAKVTAKSAYEEQERLENMIKDYMGIAVQLNCAGGTITWKNDEVGRTDWKAVALEYALQLQLRGVPTKGVVAQHTPKIGSRRFLLKF